jgi:hypothetical protein
MNLRSVHAAAIVLLGLAGAMSSSQAHACECTTGIRALSPAHGATNVPLNAEIKLLHFAGRPGTIELRRGDEMVDVTVDTHGTGGVKYVRIRPVGTLSPGTEYQLNIEGELTAFTTGTVRDETAPTAGRVTNIERIQADWQSFVGPSSCGTSRGNVLTVEPGADDHSLPADVWYHVYQEGETSPLTAIKAGANFLGNSMCNDTLDPEIAALSLRAVDMAGNESNAGPDERLASCGCSSGMSSPWAAAPLLFALLFLPFTSRRRTRTS